MCEGANASEKTNELRISKRQFLTWGMSAGLIPLTALFDKSWGQNVTAERPPMLPATINQRVATFNTCYLTTQAIEGPFYLDKEIVRSDIRDGQPGEKLQLRFQVVDGNHQCAPVKNAMVSIWMCNAAGVYSGYPAADFPPDKMPPINTADGRGHIAAKSDERYLRGIQPTDEQGRVVFTAIVPGWYVPRVAHLHLRVYLNEREACTTQLFFPQSLLNDVHSRKPYMGPGLFTNENDPVRLQASAGERSILKMSYHQDKSLLADAQIVISHI